jgi:hypothetical protein
MLVPWLVEVLEEGHKANDFSQFTSLLALLRPRAAAFLTKSAICGAVLYRRGLRLVARSELDRALWVAITWRDGTGGAAALLWLEASG